MEDFWHLVRFHPELQINRYVRPAPPLLGPLEEQKEQLKQHILWAVQKIDELDEARELRISKCLGPEKNREIAEGDDYLRVRAVLQQAKSFL